MTIKELYEAAVALGSENRELCVDTDPNTSTVQVVNFEDLHNADPKPGFNEPPLVIIRAYKKEAEQ